MVKLIALRRCMVKCILLHLPNLVVAAGPNPLPYSPGHPIAATTLLPSEGVCVCGGGGG